MGKKKEKSASGRRQILKLETEVKDNPLSGYFSHYIDSDEDVPTWNSAPDNVNSEVEDFLKEINAISSVTGNGVSSVRSTTDKESLRGSPIVVQSSVDASTVGNEPDSVESSNVAACAWQQCFDDSSGYTYFWNMQTNEVTWECPDEYASHMKSLSAASLKGREDQRVCPVVSATAVNTSLSTNGATPMASASSMKNDVDNKPKVSRGPAEEGKIILISSYGSGSSEEESSDDEVADQSEPCVKSSAVEMTSTSTVPAAAAASEYGPRPLHPFDDMTTYGPRLPPHMEIGTSSRSELAELPTKCVVNSSDSNRSSVVDNEVCVKSSSNSPCQSPKPWVLSAEAAVSRNAFSELEEQQEPDSTTCRQNRSHQGSPSRVGTCKADPESEMDDSRSPICNSPAADVSIRTETCIDVPSEADDGDSNDTRRIEKRSDDYLRYNPDNSQSSKLCRPGFGFSPEPPLPRSPITSNYKQCKTEFQKNTVGISFVRAETLDLNAVNKQHCNEVVIPCQPMEQAAADSDDNLDDIDVIERELDIALERNKDLTSKVKEDCTGSLKRPLLTNTNCDSIGLSSLQKRLRLSLVSEGVANEDSQVISKNSLGDASAVLVNRLNHLGAKLDDLSELQILLVETKTRVKDWIYGALNTGYFLKELRAADHKVRLLESAGIPEGWTCQWDSCCRWHNVGREFLWDMDTDEDLWKVSLVTIMWTLASSIQNGQIRSPTNKSYIYTDTKTGQSQKTVPVTEELCNLSKRIERETANVCSLPVVKSDDKNFSVRASTSSSDVSSTLTRNEASHGYMTTFLSEDANLPPLPSPVPPPPPPPTTSPPLPPPPMCASPPPLPPDIPSVPPLPPDSTDFKVESSCDVRPFHGIGYEGPNTTLAVPTFPAYNDCRFAREAYAAGSALSSSALESEIDSFYSNIAADEVGIDLTWSAPAECEQLPQLPPQEVAQRPLDLAVVLEQNLAPQPSMSTTTTAASTTTNAKKKVKKTKISSGLVLKKKNIPSLVEKWKRIKNEQLEDDSETMISTSSRTGSIS